VPAVRRGALQSKTRKRRAQKEKFARLAAPAGAGAHQPLYVGVHQPLRHEGDHLAQQIPVGPLLKQFGQRHPVVGHRFNASVWLKPGNSNPTGRTDGPRKGPPLPRSFYAKSGTPPATLRHADGLMQPAAIA
jgi:hypothetical protein